MDIPGVKQIKKLKNEGGLCYWLDEESLTVNITEMPLEVECSELRRQRVVFKVGKLMFLYFCFLLFTFFVVQVNKFLPEICFQLLLRPLTLEFPRLVQKHTVSNRHCRSACHS